jgi:serine/threonine protein kinase
VVAAGAQIPGYELAQQLSRSAQGETWRAHDGNGNDVVVKLHPRRGAHGDALIAFTSRATSASRLAHPNVAALRSRGQAGDFVYSVRQYFSGGWLGEVAPSLGLPEKLRLGVAIGQALEHAHERGLVHGAVKPANIVFQSRERPVLVDFALIPSSQSTDFDAPKQPESVTADPRSDQYSLAALVSWMLLGRVATPQQTISEDETVDKVLRRALAPAPTDRHRRLDELVGALEAAARRARNESSTPPAIRVECVARMLRVRVSGKWTAQTVESCAKEIAHAIESSGASTIGYLFAGDGSCHSTAIEALADLHRRHRPRLRRVGFVADSPQARGASVLIGSRVEGLAWKTFSSADMMDGWLREGSSE